uniref:Ig-like domain-containing protein n=1 Tax=Monopterus albus TaxID=43700 RepID=A0A3Q3QDP2_MONAL
MDDGTWGYVGSKVDLRCRFINSSPPVKVSQVTWQKLVNGTKQNVAIANPSLGVSVAPSYRDRVTFKNAAVKRRTPTLEDTTITFSSLRLSDDATYICEYATFPAGNRENTVNLTVYVRPTTQMSLSTPTLVAGSSSLKTPVATCISANGKPPVYMHILWETRVPGEVSTQEYRNPDGTFTVQSDYILTPSKETHKETLACVSTYNEEVFTDSVTLDIQYEPDVSVDGFDGNWYLNREDVQLSCQADANPAVSLYQWRLINGSMPSNVEVRDSILTFKGPVTYDLQGIYVCDATNSIGTRSASVEVSILGTFTSLLYFSIHLQVCYSSGNLSKTTLLIVFLASLCLWLTDLLFGSAFLVEAIVVQAAIFSEKATCTVTAAPSSRQTAAEHSGAFSSYNKETSQMGLVVTLHFHHSGIDETPLAYNDSTHIVLHNPLYPHIEIYNTKAFHAFWYYLSFLPETQAALCV